MKIYQFRNKETGLMELVTRSNKVIEEHFKMSISEINDEIKKTGLLKGKYELIVIFIDWEG